MNELVRCHREECAPALEVGGVTVRCSTCGVSSGFCSSEEHARANWDAQTRRSNDNVFDGLAQMQWERDSVPFFVGKVKEGFWVCRGQKFATHVEAMQSKEQR